MAEQKSLRQIQMMVHALAVEKGWWSADTVNVGERLLLINSEISEAFEEYRNGRGLTVAYKEADGKPCGFGVELADALIRLLDFAEGIGIDLEALVLMKHEYNKQRAWRHGGKKA